jgi:hypothetical protein
MTPQNVNHDFSATFIGRKEDLPNFYGILERVTPYE